MAWAIWIVRSCSSVDGFIVVSFSASPDRR
jgi:hypothetical protein